MGEHPNLRYLQRANVTWPEVSAAQINAAEKRPEARTSAAFILADHKQRVFVSIARANMTTTVMDIPRQKCNCKHLNVAAIVRLC